MWIWFDKSNPKEKINNPIEENPNPKSNQKNQRICGFDKSSNQILPTSDDIRPAKDRWKKTDGSCRHVMGDGGREIERDRESEWERESRGESRKFRLGEWRQVRAFCERAYLADESYRYKKVALRGSSHIIRCTECSPCWQLNPKFGHDDSYCCLQIAGLPWQ